MHTNYDQYKLASPPDDDDTPRIRAQHALDNLNDALFEVACEQDHEGTPIGYRQAMDLYLGNLMRRDHLGPSPGKCFMSLNLPAADMLVVANAMALFGGDAEAAMVAICREWLERPGSAKGGAR